MKSLCIAALIVLVAFVIWRGAMRPDGPSVCPMAGLMRRGPMPRREVGQVRIEVPLTTIKPPIMGASLGPRKDVAKSDLLSDPEDSAVKGRYAYTGNGGMSCPNARWYSSVYSNGPYTEIDSPGVAARDLNDPDLYVMGNPPDPDAVRAFAEPKSQRNMFGEPMLV